MSTISKEAARKEAEGAYSQLQEAMEHFANNNDPESFLQYLRVLARAQGGMSSLSKKVGINRQNLYRTFASSGNPKFKSLNTILKGLGYRLSIERYDATNQNSAAQNEAE